MKIIVAQLIVGNFSQVSVTLRTLKKILQTPFTMILNIYLKSPKKSWFHNYPKFKEILPATRF